MSTLKRSDQWKFNRKMVRNMIFIRFLNWNFSFSLVWCFYTYVWSKPIVINICCIKIVLVALITSPWWKTEAQVDFKSWNRAQYSESMFQSETSKSVMISLSWLSFQSFLKNSHDISPRIDTKWQRIFLLY